MANSSALSRNVDQPEPIRVGGDPVDGVPLEEIGAASAGRPA
jgi:hypothetical protein